MNWTVLKVKAQKLDNEYRPLVVAILHSDGHARLQDGTVLRVVRERPSKLTPARLQALKLAAAGLTAVEAAAESNVAPTTMRGTLLGARRAIGAKTTGEAIAIGVREEWL